MPKPAQVNSCFHLAGFIRIAMFSMSMVLSPAFSVNPETHDLVSLFDSARRNDAAYLAARAQLDADLEIRSQARAALLPQVNAGVQLEKQENTFNAFGGSIKASRDPGTYALVINQALFQPRAWESYKQSELNEELAKLQFVQAEQDLILRLSRAYFDLLATQDELANLAAQKAAVSEQLAFAKASFEVGNATITDQQEAQAQYDILIAQELAANNQLMLRALQLEAIVHHPVRKLARLQNNVLLKAPQPNNTDEWVALSQTGSPAVKQAQIARLIAKSESKKAAYGHLPTVDLTAQVVKTEQQNFDGTQGQPFDLGINSATVGISMNIPLFSGGGTQGKVRQQAALLEKSRHNEELARRSAELAAKSAFLGVQTGLAQISALETATASSDLALKSSKTAYEVGIRTNLDVLNAQQQSSITRRNLLKAQYSSLISLLELQAATGQLNASSLQEINNLLVR